MYLSLDACYVGIIAAALCMSFFPKGLTRIGLLTLLFPLFSLALCAWMTVFGFYLRLEDREKRKVIKTDNYYKILFSFSVENTFGLTYIPIEISISGKTAAIASSH